MEEEMKVEEIKVEEGEGEGTKEGGDSNHPPAVPRQPDELPTPLSDKLMQEVLAELPTGARLATETCYQCWKDGKFPTSELMSFLRSICKHSRSLHDVFNKVDGAAAPSGAEKGSGTEGGGGSSTGRSAGAQDRMERYSMEESSGPENEEDPAVTETDIEHLRLMRLEVQRRRYDSRKGTTSQKQAQFLKWCISGLASALQPSGKARLAEYIHEYLWNATSPDAVKAFAERIQTLADDYQVRLQLNYQPLRQWEGQASEGGEGKRREMEPSQKHTTSSGGGGESSKTRKKSNVGAKGRHTQAKEQLMTDEELAVVERQLGIVNRATGEPLRATALQDTPLGDYLTNKAKTASTRDVVVKVVADVLKQHRPREGSSGSGKGSKRDAGAGAPYRQKAIFAFQRVDNSKHYVMCFVMFVNEYGPSCSAAHRGRVYVECIDSVPLYGLERGDERQILLSAIVHGYFYYARVMGFRHVHMRVPPPTDETSYVFESRSLAVRLRASLHLAHWYTRLLQRAKELEIIHGYEGGTVGNMANFPTTMLEPGGMNAEIAFKHMDARMLDPQTQELVARVMAQRERCFTITLQHPNSNVMLVPDTAPLLSSSLVSDRQDFVGVCVSQSLRFASLQQAKYSTIVLVNRMLIEQSMNRDYEGHGQASTEELMPPALKQQLAGVANRPDASVSGKQQDGRGEAPLQAGQVPVQQGWPQGQMSMAARFIEGAYRPQGQSGAAAPSGAWSGKGGAAGAVSGRGGMAAALEMGAMRENAEWRRSASGGKGGGMVDRGGRAGGVGSGRGAGGDMGVWGDGMGGMGRGMGMAGQMMHMEGMLDPSMGGPGAQPTMAGRGGRGGMMGRGGMAGMAGMGMNRAMMERMEQMEQIEANMIAREAMAMAGAGMSERMVEEAMLECKDPMGRGAYGRQPYTMGIMGPGGRGAGRAEMYPEGMEMYDDARAMGQMRAAGGGGGPRPVPGGPGGAWRGARPDMHGGMMDPQQRMHMEVMMQQRQQQLMYESQMGQNPSSMMGHRGGEDPSRLQMGGSRGHSEVAPGGRGAGGDHDQVMEMRSLANGLPMPYGSIMGAHRPMPDGRGGWGLDPQGRLMMMHAGSGGGRVGQMGPGAQAPKAGAGPSRSGKGDGAGAHKDKGDKKGEHRKGVGTSGSSKSKSGSIKTEGGNKSKGGAHVKSSSSSSKNSSSKEGGDKKSAKKDGEHGVKAEEARERGAASKEEKKDSRKDRKVSKGHSSSSKDMPPGLKAGSGSDSGSNLTDSSALNALRFADSVIMSDVDACMSEETLFETLPELGGTSGLTESCAWIDQQEDGGESMGRLGGDGENINLVSEVLANWY